MLYACHFSLSRSISFFFNDTATTEIYTLSLHDALPICRLIAAILALLFVRAASAQTDLDALMRDRKSTRLNSSHMSISYAVFCLKKKKNSNTHPALGRIHPTGRPTASSPCRAL